MTFELSPEHEQFRRSVAEFARAEIAPHAAQWDRDHHFPTDVVQKMGQLGLMGLTAPEEYGGAGLAGEDGGFTSLCLAIEELGRVDQSMGITLEAAVGLGINPILTFGTDEQKQTWLPDLVSGQRLAGFGLTEPGAGSDAGATRTKAVLDGGEWVVNGSKQFITNSGSDITSVVTVTARTGEREGGRPEISTIMLPAGTPGFVAEKAYDKLGWHASDTHPLSFEDVRVPEANLLGERGRGYAQFLATLDDGRVAIAALAVGCIQACLDLSLEYAGQRQTFGGPIGRKQGVAFQISDLQVMLDASRLLTYKAAAMKDAMDAGRSISTQDFKQAAAVAKLYATESAVTATRIATQVFGGYGFMEEYPVARLYRDAKVLEIGEGTSEVQRMLIARGLGLPVE
ncbi:acyl-CoA dehydrogenase [Nocardioides seonyuensis]|uniref:Acyl-CoA dehydrogenase n=1 Tax=Nocardioides seonyuensis TaxID=2518371 RepID=A0A4P7IK32_9ACTN|nr:acyl-CoA dehydrogenase family protein [Nocardioides seonyuensis]QBX56271.1 acyl-CoA dehydrogenase [Nocardioides seonyuensis]